MIHELCFSPRIEDMTDDWVEEHMKDVTVAASQLHNEVLKPIFGNARHRGTRESNCTARSLEMLTAASPRWWEFSRRVAWMMEEALLEPRCHVQCTEMKQKRKARKHQKAIRFVQFEFE